MMRTGWVATALLAASLACRAAEGGERQALFDGRSFVGWEGETNRTWRIEAGEIVGGSLAARVPRNEFLKTLRSYTNFVLRLEFKLQGTNGFVNGGVQIRSQPAANPPNEMVGYQCDIGEGYWGALYDESRRNRILAKPDAAAMQRAVRRNDWNEYVIRCEGRRIRAWLNGEAMIDYTEADEAIPQHGRVGLQIHGGACAEIRFRSIALEELPWARESPKPDQGAGYPIRTR